MSTTTDAPQWAKDAAREITDAYYDGCIPIQASFDIRDIIARHAAAANAARQDAVRHVVASLAGAPDGPEDDDFIARYEEWRELSCDPALESYRSLPPDTQDAATAEREALLRRAVEIAKGCENLACWSGDEYSAGKAKLFLADAARLGVKQ